jgi:hypothetical protein
MPLRRLAEASLSERMTLGSGMFALTLRVYGPRFVMARLESRIDDRDAVKQLRAGAPSPMSPRAPRSHAGTA